MYRDWDVQIVRYTAELLFLTITLVLIMIFVKFFKILFFSYNKTWFFTKMPQLEGKIGYKRKNSLLFILIITKHSLLWWDTNTTALDKSNNKKYEWITNFKSQKRCWHNTQNGDSVTVVIYKVGMTLLSIWLQYSEHSEHCTTVKSILCHRLVVTWDTHTMSAYFMSNTLLLAYYHESSSGF